jgi:TP901 family phage tail tape measure protein
MAIIVPIVTSFNSKGLNKAIREIQRAEGAFNKFVAGTDAIGTSFKNTGKSLSMNLTAPLALAGAGAASLAIGFDSSMTKIVSLVGIASDEVNAFRGDVLKLSGETGKAPLELADGLFVLTSAGLRGNDALSALEAAAKASSAGLGETNDIARAVAGAMTAYGTETIDAAKATDIITATARAGNFEVSQFSAALGKVLPFAKQAGASLEDVGGAVALLTRVNGDAAISVTQVQALLKAFVVPTREAVKALDSVGLSAGDLRAAISTDGLPAALEMLDEKLGGNREQLGRLLGSSEASSAAFQILDADAEALAGTFGVTNDAIGMTQSAFDTTADTAGFKMQKSLNGLKVVAIELGDTLVPFIEKLSSAMETVTTKFQALSPEQKNLIVNVGLVLAALGPLLIIIGTLISALGKFAIAMKIAGIVLLFVGKVALVALYASLILVAQSILLVGKALIFLTTNPIGIVILGIAALIALIILAVRNWDNIKEAATNAMERIKEIVGSVANFVIDKFKALGQFILDNHPLLILFRAVRDFAPTVIEWFQNLGVQIMNGLRDGIISAATGALDAIRNTVSNGVNIAKNLLKIKSPSKVFADLGKNTMEGYIKGIESMSNAVDSTMANVGMDSTVALNGSVGVASAGGATNGGMGGNVYNINVNAGMGTNGAQVGKEIVDAIKRFEKTSGPVFASA